MNEVFKCPFCESHFPLTPDTYVVRYPSFMSDNWLKYETFSINGSINYPNMGSTGVEVVFLKCPNCNNTSTKILGKGSQFAIDYERWFFPDSNAKLFPNYIPDAILEDYEESYKILHLSPKSSATLSRRCIQGMIRDKWGISKKSLYEEINAIKDKIEPDVWGSIDALRQLGNIGAHMEKDINLIINVDPTEAKKLIQLVEILIEDWYIVPHKRKSLFRDIVDVNTNKQSQRKPPSS